VKFYIHLDHLNDVKVDQNFKDMTKMLTDLADHVEGKPSTLKRKSSMKKSNKIIYFLFLNFKNEFILQ